MAEFMIADGQRLEVCDGVLRPSRACCACGGPVPALQKFTLMGFESCGICFQMAMEQRLVWDHGKWVRRDA